MIGSGVARYSLPDLGLDVDYKGPDAFAVYVKAEGPYVVRLKIPAGFTIAPHTHPNDENVTVLSGTFAIGTGE